MVDKTLKNIGIDCRFWGIKHAGLGRYTRNLVLAILSQTNPQFRYTLFFQKGEWREDEKLLKNATIIEVSIPHYSLKEQTLLPGIVDEQKLILMHYPHFNVPILAKTPFVVTIHDLIKHFFKGRPVTTRNTLLYWVKYGGYRVIISEAVRRAKHIITPSLFTKDQVSVHYPGSEKKTTIIYEGVAEEYVKSVKPEREVLKKYNLTAPFFVYTGSAYPSKNLPVLLNAFEALKNKGKNVKLLIACARDAFWKKLEDEVKRRNIDKSVILPGKVPDSDLLALYQNAAAFIMPSLMEGFGLPGLEALSAGCPLISSNAGSLPEIYEDAAFYFNPTNEAELVERMEEVLTLTADDKRVLSEKGQKQVDKYSWAKAAGQTVSIYSKVLQG